MLVVLNMLGAWNDTRMGGSTCQGRVRLHNGRRERAARIGCKLPVRNKRARWLGSCSIADGFKSQLRSCSASFVSPFPAAFAARHDMSYTSIVVSIASAALYA